MIFALAKEQPALFVMLTEQDVNDMRGGRTVFVDQRHLEGKQFEIVVLSLHKSNEEAVSILKRVGGIDAHTRETPPTQPVEGEERCPGCQGVGRLGWVYDGLCLLCWREKARVFKQMLEAAGRGL